MTRKKAIFSSELTWCWCWWPKDFLSQRITLPPARWRKDLPPRDVSAALLTAAGDCSVEIWLSPPVLQPARSFISDNWADVYQGRGGNGKMDYDNADAVRWLPPRQPYLTSACRGSIFVRCIPPGVGFDTPLINCLKLHTELISVEALFVI